MKIQDVLLDGGREEEKAALMQRHQELMKEIKKKSQKKVEAKDTEAKAENKKDAVDKDAINYVESLDRIKAASIAARIARGEEIARAQKDFLSTNYPDMLRDANLVKTKIEKVFDMLEEQEDKNKAEKVLQKIDSSILTLPYGDNNSTVFDRAVKIVNLKK